MVGQVGDLVSSRNNESRERIGSLFKQVRALASLRMQGNDLSLVLKKVVPVTRFGELYESVRYSHGMNSYRPNESTKLRHHELFCEG